MKKLVPVSRFLALLLLISSFTVVNQIQLWDHYKLEISVPADLKVTENTSEGFGMEGDGIQLKINSFEQNVSTDDLGDAALEAATTLKLEGVGEQQEIETTNLEGYYVEGILNDDRVMLAAVMDPDSTTNFLVIITFNDEDEAAEASAFAMLNSIRRRK